jgi:hypothetical protein
MFLIIAFRKSFKNVMLVTLINVFIKKYENIYLSVSYDFRSLMGLKNQGVTILSGAT